MNKVSELCEGSRLVIDTNKDLIFSSAKFSKNERELYIYTYGQEKKGSNQEYFFMESTFRTQENRFVNFFRWNQDQEILGFVPSPGHTRRDYLMYWETGLGYVDPLRDRNNSIIVKQPEGLTISRLFWPALYDSSVFIIDLENNFARFDLNKQHGRIVFKKDTDFFFDKQIIDVIPCEMSDLASFFCLSLYEKELAMYDTRAKEITRYEMPVNMTNLSVSNSHFLLSCTDISLKISCIFDLR